LGFFLTGWVHFRSPNQQHQSTPRNQNKNYWDTLTHTNVTVFITSFTTNQRILLYIWKFFVPASTGTLYKVTLVNTNLTSCARGDTICLRPCKLTISSYLFARWHLFPQVGYLRHQQKVDLLTLKVVSESLVTWATSVPILVLLGFSVLELGPMYVTDVRQTDVRQKHRLMPPPYGG